MTVRLQTPFAGQNISTLYTGASEAALIGAGVASLLATTGAGTGAAAAVPAVRLATPYAGQGVGTIYTGSDRASVVAAGNGYFEGTVSAGDYGSVILARAA
jgi:hypothetical protein